MNSESLVEISRSPHRPVHWYVDQGCYWITGATLHHAPHFREDARKEAFVRELYSAAEQWAVEVVAWTLMEHHHHMIVYPDRGRSLPRFLGRLHGNTSRLVNDRDGTPGRQVWRQYWDTLLRSDGDFLSRVNYIWWNPVKHGCCQSPGEWRWTNLHPLMSEEATPEARSNLARFPAPRKLPGDDW